MPKETREELTQLIVNGRRFEIKVKPEWTLAYVLRDKLGLTGTKVACSGGQCGACAVIVATKLVPACLVLAIEVGGKHILTIEGLSEGARLHPIQEAWLEEHGAQCGFCSPGMILTAKALLDRNPRPTEADVKEALAGNICICGNYEHITRAVLVAAEKMRSQNG